MLRKADVGGKQVVHQTKSQGKISLFFSFPVSAESLKFNGHGLDEFGEEDVGGREK